MWRWVALFIFGAAACTSTRYTVVDAAQTSEFVLVRIGNRSGYIIDPRTQTCLLIFQAEPTFVHEKVDCAKLKQSVPEAARYISWDGSAK